MITESTSTPKLTPFEQREQDRLRLKRAFYGSAGLVALLLVIFIAQSYFDWRTFAVYPRSASGLLGILTAPLLHGSWEHLAANSVAILVLGTLAGSVYPRATARALPIIWLGSGIGAWWWGYPGYWGPGYWGGNWGGGWYYPYAVTYSYSTNSFLTEMVNLKAEQGDSKKLPVVWTSYLTGFETGSKAINRTLAVEAVNQSFTQSPYLTNK